MTYTECDDTSSNNTVREADSSNNFCNIDGDTEECFHLVIRINLDSSYERIFVDQVSSGGFFSSSPDKTTGTYKTQSNTIEFCTDGGVDDCYTMTLDEGQRILSWRIQGSSCIRTYSLLRQ